MTLLDLTQFEGYEGQCTCADDQSEPFEWCTPCLRRSRLKRAAPELLAEVKRLRAALGETAEWLAAGDMLSASETVVEALEGK